MKRGITTLIVIIVSVVLLTSGCDESINPVAPFQPRLVIYSVLSTNSDTQYVRVYTTYYQKEKDSVRKAEPLVDDATVIISQISATYSFRDTLLERPDKSRYTDGIRVFLAHPFRPESNQEYTLEVFSPRHGRAFATTRVPGIGQLSLINSLILEKPIENASFPILATAYLSANAEAYLVRLYLVFVAENPGEGIREHYYEVPQFVKLISRINDEYENIYPIVNRRSPTSPTPTVSFANNAYLRSITEIRRFNFNVRFQRAVLYLVQFDKAWYKYYGTTRLYNDRFSIRLDEPDYTNVTGGAGLFGSFRVDSLVYQLPEFIED